jgi:hypothetical protein
MDTGVAAFIETKGLYLELKYIFINLGMKNKQLYENLQICVHNPWKITG